MLGFARRRDMAAWRGRIEALADFPWQPEIAGVALTIAPCQIDADGISPDMIERIGNGNVAAIAADRNNQFDLELKVGRKWRIRHLRAIEHDGIARLLEEEPADRARRLPSSRGCGRDSSGRRSRPGGQEKSRRPRPALRS